MLDDHAVSYGRQTNGKYIILLMLLALASLLGAWAMEHKGEVQSTLAGLLPETQQPMDWQDAPSNGASSVFGCKDGAVLLTDGTLYHLKGGHGAAGNRRRPADAPVRQPSRGMGPIGTVPVEGWGVFRDSGGNGNSRSLCQ